GNWFLENDLIIARLDKLSRNEDVQAKLAAPDCRWDLVVCDEAHKLSATFFGGEIKYTKRYRLGQMLSGLTRHFLLMTATPHNDKRAGTVGFPLTILQRRLASSPEAIYQTLRRRRERLEKRQREMELLQRGAVAAALAESTPTLDPDDVEDLEDAPENEVQAAEEEILDQATAARTIEELKAEIATLSRLENLALSVRRSGT